MKATHLCTVADCDRPHLARGYCVLHYNRWKRHGDPLKVLPRANRFVVGHPGRPRQTDYAALFETYVDRTTTPDGCHIWTAARDRDGYGVFNVRRRYVRAHRFALMQAVGPLTPDQFACHRCDNPPCVRVDHLFVGDVTDNNRDKIAKGRHRTKR